MLYLRKVSISEFRPFGKAAQFDLPGPGVSILVGPNGLGKSAFFESLEWALTGRVERLERLPPERSGRGLYGRVEEGRTTPFDCRVALTFGGRTDAIVERTVPYGPTGEPRASPAPLVVTGAGSVLSLLKARAWPLDVAEDSLSTYLRTTHFLAQSAAVRLISQDPKQRWVALSQLNGAGLLERAQQRLLSRATTSALEDQIESARLRLSAEQERLEKWLALIESRDRLALQATAEGAMPPGDVVVALARLLPSLKVSQDSVEASLGVARKSLDDASVETAQRARRLDSMKAVPARFLAGVDQLAASRVRLAELEATQATASAELTRLAGQLAAAVRSEKNAAATSLANHSHEARIQRLRSGLRELSAVEVRLAEQERNLGAATETSAALEKSLASSRELLSRLEQLHRDSNRSSDRITVLEALSRTSETVELKRIPHNELLKSVDSTRGEVARSREAAGVSERRALDAVGIESLARVEAAAARAGAAELSQALAAVAALISETDESCPVCQSRVGSGELKRRADAAAQASNATVAAAELKLQRAAEATREAQTDSRAAVEKVNRLASSLARGETELLEFRKSEAELGQMAAAQGLATADIPAAIADAIERERTRSRELRTTLESNPALHATRVLTTELEGQLTSIRSNIEAQAIALSQLRSQRNGLSAMVAEHTADEVALARAEATANSGRDTQIAEDARREQEARRLRTDLERAHALAKESSDKALAEVVSWRSTAASTEEQVEQLRVTWRGVFPSGDPSESQLAEAQRVVASRLVDVAGNRARLDEVVRGLANWKSQQALAEKQAQVARFMAESRVTTEAGVAVEIRRQLGELRADVSRCEATRDAVGRFKTIIKEVTNSYFEEVVAPLNLVEHSFASALTVRTPFSVEWATRLSRGATHLDLQGRFSGGVETVSAGHVLSEGQLAATAFTQLVSLSTGYRWSDWRALLLDDPVQHNDVLHVSAFVDLVRNLVRDQKYQVVLSTHDPSIAEFAARKFRAARDIDFSVYWFTGMTETGVRYRGAKE